MSYNNTVFHRKEAAMDKESTVRIFRDPPVLKTERLILRRMLRSDASDMFEYARLPEVTKYLLWEPHLNEKCTARYLSYIQSQYRAGEFYDWAVTLNGKMIGTCGFTEFDHKNNSAEVGYVLNPAFHHRGLATEALLRIMCFGFSVIGLHRIEAKFMVGNDESRRVMERVGMTFEGVAKDSMFVKGHYVSVGTCAVTKDDFLNLFIKAE